LLALCFPVKGNWSQLDFVLIEQSMTANDGWELAKICNH
jgi:hypothetical protein